MHILLKDACYAKLDSKISLEPALSSLTLHFTRSKAALASSAELCPRSAVRSWMNMPSFSFTLFHQLLDVRMREIDVQVTEGSAEGMTFIVWEYLPISFGSKRGTYDSRIDDLIM